MRQLDGRSFDPSVNHSWRTQHVGGRLSEPCLQATTHGAARLERIVRFPHDKVLPKPWCSASVKRTGGTCLTRSERQRLGVVIAPMRLQIGKPPGQRPTEGQAVRAMYIGRSHSLCQYRYVRTRGFNTLLATNGHGRSRASLSAALSMPQTHHRTEKAALR